ncbi:hypothetical protein GE09DRAFT_1023195 [Coniochaeta sp. 2T2.1]|nr:hypothetical protein GE09DRAFT_1023195 [Coniochaeta sp. 2T2.1]
MSNYFDSESETSVEAETPTKSETSVESQTWRDNLRECLDQIKSTGDFAVLDRHTTFPNPGLEIDGYGAIPLPLSLADAEAIKTRAEQATYANREWESYLDNHVLKRAAAGLGLTDIAARLQKLLLYEKGSFFKPHKDSEVEPGMVGTLVVCLPSQHKGGEVHLSFKSEKRTLASDTAQVWDLTALAWFSDVTHEVAELTDGYRLVLTYNLIQTVELEQSAQFFHQQLERLRTVIMNWDGTQPVYYPLDHLYSETVWPLSMDKMKGRDRAVCRLLHGAWLDSGISLFIANMSHIEYHDVDYGEPEETTTLNRVYTCDGTRVVSDLEVDKEDFLGPDPFDREPDSETIGGYRVGYDHCQGNSRYNYTVAMLLPWRSLDQLAQGMHTPVERETLVTMAKEKLLNHEDPALEAASLAIYKSAVTQDWWEKVHPTPLTIQIVLQRALATNNNKLYQQVTNCGLEWVDTQDAVLTILGEHLQDRSPQTIEWETWFEHFAKRCCLAPWQRAVEQFPNHLRSEGLRESFKAWGQARADKKFDNTSRLYLPTDDLDRPEGDCGDDYSFLIKSIESRPVGSSWTTSCMLPALVSRGSRELLYKVLGSFFKRRETEHFAFAKVAFEHLVQHALAKLALLALGWRTSITAQTNREAFVVLLDQCLSIRATEEAAQLLEASSQHVEKKSSVFDEWHYSGWKDIVPELLTPLSLTLHKHGMSNLVSLAKALYVTIIQSCLFQRLGVSGIDWSYELRDSKSHHCNACGVLDRFLVAAGERTLRLAADGNTREHIESVLIGDDDGLTVTTECNTTLVVVKMRAKPSVSVKRYNEKLEELQSMLAPLKGDIMRSILGEDR